MENNKRVLYTTEGETMILGLFRIDAGAVSVEQIKWVKQPIRGDISGMVKQLGQSGFPLNKDKLDNHFKGEDGWWTKLQGYPGEE